MEDLCSLALGNNLGAGEFPIVELVSHQCLKGVSQWINVRHPPRRSRHMLSRRREVSVNHEAEAKNSATYHGLARCPG